MLWRAIIVATILFYSGCAAVIAPPLIVGIPANSLQEYGPAVDRDQIRYNNLKRDYEQNDCLAWDRYIHAMLEAERKKYSTDSDTDLIVRACRSPGYDCAEPPIPADLKELITRNGMPNVHCVKHPQIE
jgi:hypothetical protein